ncbi:MAG: hypothetical protein JNM07_05270 [Phycisphaerae bacterium]|nr:hypothetical protein [Phycisphaerae bacterium]
MNLRTRASLLSFRMAAGAAVVGLTGVAGAQTAPNPASNTPAQMGTPTRRLLDGPPTVLAFKGVTVEQLIPFIVEATGKVVIPQQDVLNRKITVVNDQQVPRNQALDLVFLALQQSAVGVTETATTITLRDLAEVDRQDVPVIGPDESVLQRQDQGTLAEKVFALKHSSAENYQNVLKDAIPKFAKMTVDKESNQIAIMGNIALLQRLERLITSLDAPSVDALTSATFKLKYADAAQVLENIRQLYSTEQGRGPARRRSRPDGNDQNQRRQFFGGPPQQESSAASENLRVTANVPQNSLTVVAEPVVIQEIREQIEKFWDLPLPKDAVTPRIFELKNSDPVKIKELLEKMFGQGTPSSAAAPITPQGGNQGFGPGGGRGNQSQQPARSSSDGQGIGRMAGQFSFQAIPESGRLVVVAKTPENFGVIEEIIKGLDAPQSVGVPEIVELKHASAEELGEQLNTLLALDGTLAQIRRSESGLTSNASSGASPFSTQNATTTATQNQQQDTVAADTIQFWWQRSRATTDARGASNLVGQIRLVPVWRQNSLMILAPIEYKRAVADLVRSLDRPGRQVLISAIVMEVSTEDATALGFRWSSSPIALTNSENAVSATLGGSGEKNNVLPGLFDTSVLRSNVNLNMVLQALAEKNTLKILSEPRVFTSDNQEAEFFNGQDIPFVTNSQTTTTGNVIQSFDYRAVGIQLRTRPRITVNSDVDLRVNLELSSIVPGQTLFGGFVVDRRETTTQLIVHSGQTVVISGIKRSEDSLIKRKVPLLGDIPLLGELFKSSETQRTDRELLVFITPIVQMNTENAAELNTPFLRDLEANRRAAGANDPPAKRAEPTAESEDH